MKQFIYIIFIIFPILLTAATIECIDKLNEKEMVIKELLDKDGDVYIGACKEISPYLHIIIVNLDDSRNKISLTHGTKIAKGYPLQTIEELAKQDEVLIAVNGFTWIGDQGDNNNQFAISPTGTVYSETKELNIRQSEKEVVLGFSERTHEGTKAKLFDRSNAETTEQLFLQNADNSTTSLIKHGTKTGASDTYQTSSVGIGNYDGKNILIILSSHKSESTSLLDHYDIFDYFAATEAMRLDGNSATSLYYNKHINKLSNYSPFNLVARYKHNRYGEARRIMYAITIKKVKAMEPPSSGEICPADYFNHYGTGTLDELLEKGNKDVGVSDGDKHQVKELQLFLEALGIDVGNNGTDGWFGEDTENAIKAFQQAKGLVETGKINVATQDIINASCHDKIN